jgi:hypothetical protein
MSDEILASLISLLKNLFTSVQNEQAQFILKELIQQLENNIVSTITNSEIIVFQTPLQRVTVAIPQQVISPQQPIQIQQLSIPPQQAEPSDESPQKKPKLMSINSILN